MGYIEFSYGFFRDVLGCFGHQDRIHWVANNVFGAKSNKCALAYSKVQVDCDICRACTIEERFYGEWPGVANKGTGECWRARGTKKVGEACNGFEFLQSS